MNTLQQELFQFIDALSIVDTHEHLHARNQDRNPQADIFSEYCCIYFNRDLISSGMPYEEAKQLYNQQLSIKERWEKAAPYWDRCRHTGYGKALDYTVQKLYGAPRIDGDTIEEIDRKIKQSLQTDQYELVFKKYSRITTALLDASDSLSADRRFFSPVVRLDPYIYLRTYGDLLQLERAYGKSITNLDSMKQACREALYSAKRNDAVAFKCGLAYQRGLCYTSVTSYDAEKEFNAAFDGCDLERESRPFAPGTAFQNYMMHYALSVVDELDLPLQIHTGLLEGNGNRLEQTNPELLIPLFLRYPHVRFDVFHIGYPYQHTLGGIVKMFPNVYVDMCWAQIVSPPACIHSLGEWLETIPYNKIMAFGGDHCFIDGVVGHQLLAKQNVAKALTQKITEGLFDFNEACKIAECLFYSNPIELFRLPKTKK